MDNTNTKKNIIRIGIDCHKMEDSPEHMHAGIRRHTYKLLEEISNRNDIQDKYRFYLYFKGTVPEDIPFLKNEIFVPVVAKLPFFIPFFRPSFNVFFHICVPLYALYQRVDVLFFPSFMLPALCMTKSIVLLTNDVYYEMKHGSLPFRYKIGYKLFSQWASRRATAITTQTHASQQQISEQFSLKQEDISVIPLGADFVEQQSFESVEKKDMILYSAQSLPRRHLKETLLAFELIARQPEFKNTQFLVIGSDKYNPPVVEKLIHRINHRLGGYRITYKEHANNNKELERYYKQATVFVYVSSVEGMGLPPIEALLCGTVPIVGDTPTSRELFGENAFFVPAPFTPELIASAFRESMLHKDLRQQKQEQGKRTMQKYSWKQHATQMLDLFEKTCV